MVEGVSAGQSTRRRVDIVPHTHWDREWYRPFQSFRLRLVDLLDDLLPRLEADPGYAHFMLDGQMAVVDDYLAVRPDEADRICRLVTAGRLTVGPWYILMDEFLVSGETTIRNMEMGLARAASFGGAMKVGYLPDMFGHIAQMPQILQGFGLDRAVVWRGVPVAVDTPMFRWRSPDGSEVIAEALADGYSNGAVLPPDADELIGQIEDWVESVSPRAGEPVLWMNGTDHLLPQAALGRLVADADAESDDWDLRVCSLAEHLEARIAGLDDGPVASWDGELRSGARSNLLMGVVSNRVDVRAAVARAEAALEREAEPLAALFTPPESWPEALLAEAWMQVVRNAAHDSICACSHDAVVDAVLHRYEEATAIADGLTVRSLRAIGHRAGGAEPVVVNPTSRARTGLVEVEGGADVLPGTGAADLQVLTEIPGRRLVGRGSRANLAEVVAHLLDGGDAPDALSLDDFGGVVTVTASRDGRVLDATGRADLRRTARARARTGDPRDPVEVWEDGEPRRRVLARVHVPGFSWARWALAAADAPLAAPVTARWLSMTNGLATVTVDPEDGTWTLDGVGGMGHLVDEGDVGDTYNWCPPPIDPAEIDRPDKVAVTLVESGPVRARLAVETVWTWPARAADGRRVGEVPATVRTTIELRAGDPVLWVETTVENRAEDHRVRVHLPLPAPAGTSRAGCVFATVERGLAAEGGPTELGLATFPARHTLEAGGLTVVVDGVREYELVDLEGDGPARALALTLLRCTGVVSAGPMATRAVPAGPPTPTPAAQMPGTCTTRYGVTTATIDARAAADDLAVPLRLARTSGPAGPDRDTALTVSGAEVSSVRRRGGRVEVRIWNPTDQATTVDLGGRNGWLVDLRGRALRRTDGTFDLAPAAIATVSLDEA